MLKKLRNLSSDTKKKIVIFCAGALTFVVFVFWITDFSSTFSKTIGDTKEKSAAVYVVIEENVGKVYNAFAKIMPKDQNTGIVDTSLSTTNASSTVEIATTTSATTTENMLK